MRFDLLVLPLFKFIRILRDVLFRLSKRIRKRSPFLCQERSLAQNDFFAAAEQFNRAIIIDSNFYIAWIGLGTTHVLSEDMMEADRILKKLFDIDSSLGFQMLEFTEQQRAAAKQ